MKSKVFVFLIIFSMGFFLISCQGDQEPADQPEQEEAAPAMDMAQVREAIVANNLKLGEAIRMGDAAALAALYTDEAKLLPPNSETIVGRQGIEAFWGGGIQMGIKDVVLTTVDVIEMGEMVCEIGEYKLTIQPEGMDAMEDNGKYLVIWKKAMDGSWKLHIDIWNTNMPSQ